jgi:hypothetical protein
LLTLLAVPVFYSLFEDLQDRFFKPNKSEIDIKEAA